jgi:glycosyltransferase involved in cell wall biosynthesis
LSPEKRFDLLLEAIALLPDAIRPIVLIVGSGPLHRELEELARSLHIHDRVVLLGQRDDVPDLLHAFDLLVQTSDTEGVPNAVLEAMATGVPVVATTVGGTPELIRHELDGLLVPPGNARGIAAAIEHSLSQPEQAKKRAGEARIRIERELSFETRMRRVEAVYRDVFERKASSS